jgi:mono/diheme cytochrome c family protein
MVVIDQYWEFRPKELLRGVAIDRKDPFGNGYSSVRFLEQGWSEGESAWYYTVNQGSDLLPYDFFLSLESAGSQKLLFSSENVARWRYLPQAASSRNPDALPVGFAKDEYRGRAYLGLTCAACHTAQLNYKGVALRIDGGPSLADMQAFLRDLRAALTQSAKLDANGRCRDEVCKRFVARVLARGHYQSELEVTRDLTETTRHVTLDDKSNRSQVEYGYGRLDAFGRIYNRVLGRLIGKKHLADLLPDVYDRQTLPIVRRALDPLLKESAKDEGIVIERALALLPEPLQDRLISKVFNPSDAPVSYPFLWDTPQHDFVQWNGIVSNGYFGPIARNAGEVIGVFGTLDWKEKRGQSLFALIGGQTLGEHHISYESSVYVHNLRRIEAQLTTLRSPQWPEDLLGPLDRERMRRGEVLFAAHCVGCHAEIDRAAPDRRVVASFAKLGVIRTDPAMANNSVGHRGYSGMLRNQYVEVPGVGSLLLDRRAPVAALLTKAAQGVVAEPYPNANVFRRVSNWLVDLGHSFFENEIHPSIKHGKYDPDSTVAPFDSLLSYKGRSLNGVWATSPYLHNGSIPTLYDVLLPERREGDPEGEEYRPDTFLTGSREFDPVNVGYVSAGSEGFRFDTSLPGNRNSGHEYGTIHDETLSPRALRPLTKEERLDLLEYMKSL